MMNGFEWPEELPDEIVDLKHYNGVNVSFDFFDGVIKCIIKCMSLSTGKKALESEQNIKHILFWGDFDVANIEKIANRLKLDDDHYVEIMDEPIEVLSKNLEQIYAIILIVTDCTKFSANSDARTRMNETLVEYVKKGGKLICAHDVIYRRTKNTLLQDMYGCQITNFQQKEKVNYKKTEECTESERFTSLPDDFILHDAEVCWGEMAEDNDVYFET